MSRRSARTRNKVDYSKLGSIEGISDEDVGLPRNQFESDSEGYNEEEAAADGNDDVDADMGVDDDEEEAGEPEEPDDVVDFSEGKKKRSGGGGKKPQSVKLPERREKKNVPTLSSIQHNESVKATPEFTRRSMRSENLKDRFLTIFGSNDEELVKAVFDRAEWGENAFALSTKKMKLPKEMDAWLQQPITALGQAQMNRVDDHSTFLPPADDSVSVQTEKAADIRQIKAFESVKNTTSQSLILNVGFPVTNLCWAPGHNFEDQYLAVSTLDSWDKLESEEKLAQVSAFKKEPYASSIQVYRVSSSFETELYASISHLYGSPRQMRLRPIPDFSTGVLATVACSFRDGKLRIFDIPMSEGETRPVHYFMNTPALEYELDAPITAVCWRTNNVVAVGTSSGFVAEFDTTDKTEDWNVPSFKYPVNDSAITDITSAFPDHPEILFASGTEGYGRAIDVRDIARARSLTPRLKGYSRYVAYGYHVRSFVVLEDLVTTRVTPLRKLGVVQAGVSVTRHNASVQSMATSALHPMVITGAADGSLNVGNLVRRTMLTKRLTNSFYKQANLWILDVYSAGGANNKVYRFTDYNAPSDLSKGPAIERIIIQPPDIAVTHLAWNPNINWGGVYAAGTTSGLIRIENICIE